MTKIIFSQNQQKFYNFLRNTDTLKYLGETNEGTRTRYEELLLELADSEYKESGFEEINSIIQNLKNHKAPVVDDINSKLLQMAGKGRYSEKYAIPDKRQVNGVMSISPMI